MYLLNLNKNIKDSLRIDTYEVFNFNFGYLAIDNKKGRKYEIRQTNRYICLLDGFFLKHSLEDLPLNDINSIKNFLNEVDGFFLCLLVEKSTGITHIFSDHIGSRTAYYTFHNGNLVLSNNGEHVCKLSGEINKSKIIDYFCFSVDAGSDTFFKSVKKVEPRQYISFHSDKKRVENYFSFNLEKPDYSLTEEDYISEYEKRFLEVLTDCSMKCSGIIGSALSGGLDSSSITAGLKKVTNKEIIAQTVCFEGLEGSQNKNANEIEYSSLVSHDSGVTHDVIKLKNAGCISNFEETNINFLEPTGLVNGYIHNAIFKNLQKKGVCNFFDGFAGDSVINHGYLHLNLLAKNWKIRELIYQDRLIHSKRNALEYFSPIKTLKRVLLPTHIPPKIMWYLNYFRKGENRYDIWSKRINPNLRNESIYNSLISFYGYNPLEISADTQLSHIRSIISPQITASVRNAQALADNYGIKVFFPFLSKKFIQLSINTPISLKLKNGIDRYIFRQSMKEVLPKEIVYRHTKSNLSPFSLNQIMQLDLKDLEDQLKSKCGKVFDYSYIRRKVFAQKKRYFVEIYQLYEFNKWLEKRNIFID